MTKTILLADDSVTIQKVVELTFMDEDYRVVSVGNGEEALARLDEVAPDLVIADVHMPGANGYDVCRQAKARRGVPVLLLVGTFEPFDEGQARSVAADGHLKKPFDSQELLRVVDSLLAKAGARAAAAAPREDDRTEELLPSLPPLAAPAAPAAANAPTQALPAQPAAGGPAGRLSDEDVDRVARRVVEILSEKIVREVAWEVVPDLAEVVIKDRLRELETQVE